MKSVLNRGLVASLFVLAGASAFAADYKLYYCYADLTWRCTNSSGAIDSKIPTFYRGDHIQLFIIQNTLKTTVKVEFAQETFASTAPDILTKLLPGTPSGSGVSPQEKLKELADLYPLLVEKLRAASPECPSTPSKSGEFLTSANGYMLMGDLQATITEKVKGFDDNGKALSGRVRALAINALQGSPIPTFVKVYNQAVKMADLLEKIEKNTLFQSGPYEIEPDSDLLTAKLTFTPVTAPDWGVILVDAPAGGGGAAGGAGGPGAGGGAGGPGAGVSASSVGGQGEKPTAQKPPATPKAGGTPPAAKDPVTPPKEDPKKDTTPAPKDDQGVPPADARPLKKFYLGSRGLGHTRPSYSVGLSNSSLMDVSFRKVTTGSVMTVQPGAKNSWKVVPTALMHLNMYSTPDFHVGPTLGVLYSGQDLVSYFAGFSLQFGRKTRLSLNLGWQFGQVDVLDGINFGDTITADQTLTRKVWRNKSVLGISYSF